MDLVRSWLAAIVAYFVAMWLSAVYGALGAGSYDHFLSRVLWLYLPILVAYALIAAAAAAAHTRPHRGRTGRHLVAVLPIPVLSIVFSTVMSAAGYTAVSGIVLSVVFSAAGVVAGWLGADLIWQRFTEDREAYF